MLKLDARELATVLAALRYMQNDMGADWWEGGEIATDGGTLKPLSADEIDTLCERINCSPAAPRLAIVLEGGLVQCLVSDTPEAFNSADIVVIDYDTEGADDSEITGVKQGDGSTAEAVCRFEGIDHAKIDLPGLVRALEA